MYVEKIKDTQRKVYSKHSVTATLMIYYVIRFFSISCTKDFLLLGCMLYLLHNDITFALIIQYVGQLLIYYISEKVWSPRARGAGYCRRKCDGKKLFSLSVLEERARKAKNKTQFLSAVAMAFSFCTRAICRIQRHLDHNMY